MDVAYELRILISLVRRLVEKDDTWNEDVRAAFSAIVRDPRCEGPLAAAKQAVSAADFFAAERKVRQK